jgi:hypothetical protein
MELLKHPNPTQVAELKSWSHRRLHYTNIVEVPKETPIHFLVECRLTSDFGLLERLEKIKLDGFGGGTRIPKHLKTKYKGGGGRVSRGEYGQESGQHHR